MEMIPVANQTIPPNTQGSLQSLSGILGLQQQQQALQTGQYTQASALANSQQDQQKNQELQAAQTLALQGAKSGKYTNPDGTLNRQKMSDDISTVAPTYGQPIATQLLSQANEIVQNQKTHQELSTAQQQQMGNTFLGLAGDANLDNSKIINAVGNLRSNNTNPDFNRMLDSMLTHIPPNANSQQLQKLMAGWGAASTGQSQVDAGTVNTGGAIVPTTSNKFTGQTQIGGTAGKSAPTTLNPAQQPGYLQTAAAASTSGGAGAANDETAYSQIQQAGSKSKQISSMADDIVALSKQVQTGPMSAGAASKFATLAQSLGMSNAGPDTWEAKRQVLGKMAAQLRIQANMANGANTDAARADVESAYPNPDQMAPGAVQEAARYVKGLAQVNQARLNNADRFRQANNGSSLGVRAVDNQFTQNADPKAFVYDSLQPGQERQQFLKSHFTTPEQLREFLQSRALLKHQGALGGAQ
jgi:hypothetical protein